MCTFEYASTQLHDWTYLSWSINEKLLPLESKIDNAWLEEPIKNCLHLKLHCNVQLCMHWIRNYFLHVGNSQSMCIHTCA